MKIDFYYVEGLTEIDTLYFESQQQQENYFDNKKVVSYNDDAYYPPHNSVELQVDAEEVNLNKAINYVSLYYNNKYYYYFIGSINYENEGLWKLSLDIDSIQTYMFNITKIVGELERKSIDRWSPLGINRNYERENFSESEFVNYSYKELKFDDDVEFELYKYRKQFGDTTQKLNDKVVRSHFYTMIRFISLNGTSIYQYSYNNQDFNPTNQFNLADDEWCYMGTYHRSLKEFGVKYTYEVREGHTDYNLTILSESSAIVFTPFIDGSKKELLVFNCNLDNYVSEFQTDAIFEKNTSKHSLRNYKYTPFLLDNQYIKILYGERYNTNEIPLFLYNSDVFTVKIYNDIINNTRNYCIGDIKNDVNLTLLTCDSPETVELFSNPWKSYMSQNQASLSAGKFVLDPIVKGIASGIATTPVVGVAVGTGALVKNVLKYGDLKNSPDKVRQIGGYASDVLFDNITPIIKIDMVKDIQNVSDLVESIGYKVKETISSNSLFNDMNIRYYYNVIKMSDCSVTLNILQDSETVNNIRSRLENGIRMWNVADTGVIGSYTYDNIEKKYIID